MRRAKKAERPNDQPSAAAKKTLLLSLRSRCQRVGVPMDQLPRITFADETSYQRGVRLLGRKQSVRGSRPSLRSDDRRRCCCSSEAHIAAHKAKVARCQPLRRMGSLGGAVCQPPAPYAITRTLCQRSLRKQRADSLLDLHAVWNAQEPCGVIASTVNEHNGRVAVDAVALGEGLPFRRGEEDSPHRQAGAIGLLDPINDGRGCRSGRSAVGVEIQQCRPADADRRCCWLAAPAANECSAEHAHEDSSHPAANTAPVGSLIVLLVVHVHQLLCTNILMLDGGAQAATLPPVRG